jgi:hypothetical protein
MFLSNSWLIFSEARLNTLHPGGKLTILTENQIYFTKSNNLVQRHHTCNTILAALDGVI